MRWLNGITDSMDMGLGKLWELVIQGGLVCCGPWGHKESDTAERLTHSNFVPTLSLVQFSLSVVSDSLCPHGLQHARLPCPFNSWSLLKLMSIESVIPFNHLILCRPFSSRLQSFPASGSFQMSQFFASRVQSVGVSASASVLPMNRQD